MDKKNKEEEIKTEDNMNQNQQNGVVDAEFVDVGGTEHQKTGTQIVNGGLQTSYIERLLGADEDLDEAKIVDSISKFSRMVELYQLIAIQRTQKRDWVKLEGNPYCKHTGISRVARHMGVNFLEISQRREERKDSHGPYYIYFSKYRAIHPILGFAEGKGGASSRKPFFAKRNKEWRADEEIDEIDIANSADTNGKVRAFNNLFETRNIDWETLETHHPGIKNMLEVTFDKTGKGGSYKNNGSGSNRGNSGVNNNSGNSASPNGGNGQKDPREHLWEKLLEVNGGDQEKAANQLEKLSTFPNKDGKTVMGKRDHMKLSPQWAGRIMKDNPEIFMGAGKLF